MFHARGTLARFVWARGMARQLTQGRRPAFLAFRKRGMTKRRRGAGLKPQLPVSGLSLVVSHGYDAQHVGVIQVNDGKRKVVEHKPPCSVQMLGPALRRLGNAFKGISDGGNKTDTGIHTGLPVPVVRSLNFQPCSRVEPIRLTSRHLGDEPRDGGVLARPVSVSPCRIECHQPGA